MPTARTVRKVKTKKAKAKKLTIKDYKRLLKDAQEDQEFIRGVAQQMQEFQETMRCAQGQFRMNVLAAIDNIDKNLIPHAQDFTLGDALHTICHPRAALEEATSLVKSLIVTKLRASIQYAAQDVPGWYPQSPAPKTKPNHAIEK